MKRAEAFSLSLNLQIKTGEQEANKSSSTTGAKSDNIDDILSTGQSTR